MLSPGLLPKAGFAPLGCAIAYSAYVFPDTLVSTTFHDYYLTLAVLNTIVSIWLSCYSRYPAALPRGVGRGAGGGGARGSPDCRRGPRKICSGACGSVPHGLPGAGWDQLHRHTVCAGAQGSMVERASHLSHALLLLF